MGLGKFISFPILLVSILVGCIIIYLTDTNDKNVYVYPTPENVKKFLWKDATGTCYTWKPHKVRKPNDVDKIKFIPIQN